LVSSEFLLNIIPTSVVDAFAKGDILQVLLFSILFGFALQRFGGRQNMVFTFIERLSHVLFAIVGIVMKVAPIGAFGAMAFTIGKYGVGSLVSLAHLMFAFYLTCAVSACCASSATSAKSCWWYWAPPRARACCPA
jgi:aerobic C4-dicarboxylate transport protein